MIGVILAAGMATRLRPLTDNCPKCLLKIGNRSLLQRTIDAMKGAGIKELVVVTGYHGEMIRDFIQKQYQNIEVHFIDNADYKTTNNIYSLWLAKPFIAGKDFLLMDSDILFSPDIINHILKTPSTTLAMNRHTLGEEEMKVVIDDQNMVTEISKTCSVNDAAGESVGIEKIEADYSAALFKELETMMDTEHLENVFYEQAFKRLIPQGFSFYAKDTTDMFSMELDTVEDFNNAKEIIPQEIY